MREAPAKQTTKILNRKFQYKRQLARLRCQSLFSKQRMIRELVISNHGSYRNPSFFFKDFSSLLKGKIWFSRPSWNKLLYYIVQQSIQAKNIYMKIQCMFNELILFQSWNSFSLSLAPSLWVSLFYPFGLTISHYMYTFWALYDEAN